MNCRIPYCCNAAFGFIAIHVGGAPCGISLLSASTLGRFQVTYFWLKISPYMEAAFSGSVEYLFASRSIASARVVGDTMERRLVLDFCTCQSLFRLKMSRREQ